MSGRDVIVIGASAGGVEALAKLASLLTADLPAALFVVLHLPAHGTSVLPQILSRRGPLKALHPQDEQEFQHGHIYIAPPDYHLLVKRGQLRLVRGPRENRHRPAVDPLFRTAARSYGKRVIGVVLSGTLDDGTSGLQYIKEFGGIAVVQDPKDAIYPGMPQNAVENVDVDHIVPLSEMAELLTRLAGETVEDEEELMAGNGNDQELDVVEHRLDALERGQLPPGKISNLTCPDCGGTLWENHEGELMRFRCHVGHGYSAETLLAEQNDLLEDALWSAYRALEESASLAHRLEDRARARGHERSSNMFQQQAIEAEQRAALIRHVLMTKGALVAEEVEVTSHLPASVVADGNLRRRGAGEK